MPTLVRGYFCPAPCLLQTVTAKLSKIVAPLKSPSSRQFGGYARVRPVARGQTSHTGKKDNQ
ncbi:MAG: hypothetical protein KAX37_08945 [Opitutaceae bacterium]|nr:hypothetical protein [Opitutaceae bacterium]